MQHRVKTKLYSTKKLIKQQSNQFANKISISESIA